VSGRAGPRVGTGDDGDWAWVPVRAVSGAA
jgi:hypothetical protein